MMPIAIPAVCAVVIPDSEVSLSGDGKLVGRLVVLMSVEIERKTV